jgi:hypothetical protein
MSLWGYHLDIKKYNELGDFIGGVTAPFLSTIAFVLIYLTYKSQKEELSQTRTILTRQTETIDRQQFETTLFNMLNLHQDIVKSIDLIRKDRTLPELRQERAGRIAENPKETVSGRDCFKSFYEGYKNEYSKGVADKHKTGIYEYKEIINESYKKYYRRHQSDLGHYFRNLYHIFKLINKANINGKSEYASLVRAQLSSHELLMLFYNSLSDQGEKFKPLIEEFHILKGMPEDDLINENHKNLYAYSAFNKTEINSSNTDR